MLFKQLNKDKMDAMIAKDVIKRDLLRTLIGDCSKATKEPSDQDCIQMIKKFIKNAEDTQKIMATGSEIKVNEFHKFTMEIQILTAYLPRQLADYEITAAIVAATAEGADSVGTIMKYLKTNYEGKYDGKIANQLIQKFLKGE